VRKVRAQLGGTLGSFEAWLLLRGMRTLHLRVRAASTAAQRIAEHFQAHPLVAEVLYPGLPGCQGHVVARAQMQGGFGGMLSLRVRAGEAAAIAVAANTAVWKRATSLGGTESLIEHRASVEGAGTPAPPDLLRLSVGIEHVDDLIADLEQALEGRGGAQAMVGEGLVRQVPDGGRVRPAQLARLPGRHAGGQPRPGDGRRQHLQDHGPRRRFARRAAAPRRRPDAGGLSAGAGVADHRQPQPSGRSTRRCCR
jgi:hypothetical protein